MIEFTVIRRRDLGYRVWKRRALGVIALVTFLVIAVLYVFVDPTVLQMVRNGELEGDGTLLFLTQLAKSKWHIIISILLLWLLSYLSADRVAKHFRPLWNRVFFSIWFYGYSISLSGLLVLGIKYFVGRVRPRYISLDTNIEFMPLTVHYDFNSFPSGHATTAGAIAVALSLLVPKLRWVIFPFFVFVAATRVLIGVHFPSDVVGGFVFGATVTWVYARSMAKRRILFEFHEGRLRLRQTRFARITKIPQMLRSAYFNEGKATES